jgi:hypothetical protein
MAKGYSQVEDLDFDETIVPVARLDSIHILLAYATHHGFKLSNGRQECLLEWSNKRRCVCVATTRL